MIWRLSPTRGETTATQWECEALTERLIIGNGQ